MLALCAVLALDSRPAAAQPQPRVSIRQVSDADGAVTVVATVLDGAGRPLLGLAKEQFELQLDGATLPLQDLRYAADPQTGLGLVLAIDVSGSMAGQRIERARAAAAAFLDVLGPADQVALLVFHGDVALVSDFTGDLQALKAMIARLQAGGSTALYAATVAAVTKAGASTLARKAVLLVTDGENTEPVTRGTRQQALDAARDANVPVYAIGLGTDVDRPFLDELARVSRGEAAHAPAPSDLDRLYRGIGEALRGQYVLRATPTPVTRAASHRLRLNVRLNDVTAADEISFAGASLPHLPDPTPVATATPIATPTPALTVTPIATPPPATAAPAPTPATTPLPQPVQRASSPGRERASAILLGSALAVAALVAAGGAAAFAVRWWRGRQEEQAALREDPRGPDSATPLPAPPSVLTPASAPATLHVYAGPLAGLQAPVSDTPVTIGSAPDCTLVLPGGPVERRHVRIWRRDGRYMLHRLARSGEILMDGRPVQWAVLEPGDEFAIGVHRFRFALADVAEADGGDPRTAPREAVARR